MSELAMHKSFLQHAEVRPCALLQDLRYAIRQLRKSPGFAAVAGLAVGALVALTLSRILPTDPIGWSGSGIFLYHVSRTDPLTYLSAAVVLTVIALSASWLPARHAARVDPNVALRYE